MMLEQAVQHGSQVQAIEEVVWPVMMHDVNTTATWLHAIE
jgi:hypothetical protein